MDYTSQRAPGPAHSCCAVSFPSLFRNFASLGFPGLPDKESGWPHQNVSRNTPRASCGLVAAALGRPCVWWGRWLRTRGEGCGAELCATASSWEAGWWVAMWVRRRGGEVPSASASEGGKYSAAWTEMGSWVRTIGGRLKQRLRLDVGREVCRQYPLFCFLLLCLSAASLLLNRYLRLAPRRPLESRQTVLGCGQERTLHSGLGRGGRYRGRICGQPRPRATHPSWLPGSQPFLFDHFSMTSIYRLFHNYNL